MVKSAELTELAARVEAGSLRDRGLDSDIALALGWTLDNIHFRGLWKNPAGDPRSDPPEYTSSLDAVVALIPERLPGWFTHVIQRALDNKWSVELSHPTDEDCSVQSAFCTTEVRARLSCCLRALAAQQQDRRPKEGSSNAS